MKMTVVGCGDAFGSGGRLNTCFHVDLGASRFLLDCGDSAMIGMYKQGLDPNAVDTILISHLHGDHFAGLVWYLLHAQHVARRTVPLTVVGPPTIEQRWLAATEILFPGSGAFERRYELRFVEMGVERPYRGAGLTAEAFEVSHPSGAPSHALRIKAGGRTLAFSGDTEWTETLIPCADGADLFITECYAYDVPVRYHVNWLTLEANLSRLKARRIMITHMNAHMLANQSRIRDPRVFMADDGLVVDV